MARRLFGIMIAIILVLGAGIRNTNAGQPAGFSGFSGSSTMGGTASSMGGSYYIDTDSGTMYQVTTGTAVTGYASATQVTFLPFARLDGPDVQAFTGGEATTYTVGSTAQSEGEITSVTPNAILNVADSLMATGPGSSICAYTSVAPDGSNAPSSSILMGITSSPLASIQGQAGFAQINANGNSTGSESWIFATGPSGVLVYQLLYPGNSAGAPGFDMNIVMSFGFASSSKTGAFGRIDRTTPGGSSSGAYGEGYGSGPGSWTCISISPLSSAPSIPLDSITDHLSSFVSEFNSKFNSGFSPMP